MQLPEAVFGDLIPAEDLPKRLTVHAARLLAEAHGGGPVTTAQYRAFRDAGLVATTGDDGLLPGSAVNQLIAAKGTVAYARPLARRVVFLRGHYLLFPVPSDKLQRALIELVPLVDGAARKLVRVGRYGRSSESLRLRHGRLPAVKEWQPLLASVDPARIDAWTMGWYAMAREFIPAYFAPERSPLDDIPLEEQVLCLAILDLDRRSRISVQGG